jgi:hypothetical protein
MKKLLCALTGALFLSAAGGCMYTAFTSDPNGKLYMTRTNLGGLWNNQWICEPGGGKLNCKAAAFEGGGGGGGGETKPADAPK